MSTSAAAPGSSGLPGTGPIVSLDPAHPISPRPLVADILRTGYCAPGSVFLVEGIEAQIAVTSRYRAVRVLLSDGQLCVQALLRSELHGFVDGGEVYVGSYVRLDRFEARWVTLASARQDVEDDGRDNSTPAEKMQEREQMVYLLVEAIALVGWNRDFMKLVEASGNKTSSSLGVPGNDTDETRSEAEQGARSNVKTLRVSDEQSVLGGVDRPDFCDVEGDKAAEDAFEHMAVSETRATQRRQVRLGPSQLQSSALPWTSDGDLGRPLKLTRLCSIPNLPYKQNWSVNVLAVIASLSEVEPSHLPPYHQRTARLADPTTTKRVLLTIFLDPDDFTPQVGSVVLLLGVKNHRFDGGSLKKYASNRPPRRPDGEEGRWWFEEPDEIEWCDVEGLREWWRRIQGP